MKVARLVQKALHRLRERSEEVKNEFLMHYLTYLFGSEALSAGLVGKNSIPHFTREKFLQLRIPIPEKGEQSKIVKALSGFEETVGSNVIALDRLNGLKSALMSDLLTGRKRVTEAMPLAAE